MDSDNEEYEMGSLSQLKIAKIESLSDMSNDLLHIRSDLFSNQQDMRLNLQNLFSESHSFLDFIKLECKKFEGIITRSCERLMQRLTNLQMSDCQLMSIKDQMMKLGFIRKDKVSVFDFEALKQRDFDFFVKKLHSTYIDNTFNHLRILLDTFLELAGDGEGNNISMSNKSCKKVLWTPVQESELLALMQQNYPESLTNQEMVDFCDRHKRTRGAVVNKIQKLKKKYAEELTKQSEFIINSMLNGGYSERGFEDRIQDILMLRGHKTYEEILDELKISNCEVSKVEMVNRTLYDLLNRHKVNCKDQLYVSLQPTRDNDNLSVILSQIIEMIRSSERGELSFDTVKSGLIDSFKQLDPNKKSFDDDLRDFISNSGFLILKQKRVFYT